MRILHVDTGREWYGGQRQAFYLAQGLSRLGHENTVVAPPRSPLAERCREVRLSLIEMPMHGEVDPVAIFRLRRLIKERNFDLVHAHTAHAHTLIGLATLGNQRVKKVVSRRVDYSIFRSGSSLSRIKYRHFGIDQYIAVSNLVARVMQQDGIDPERISVVYDGVQVPKGRSSFEFDVRRDYGISQDAPIVGTVAQFSDYKGYQFLVKAVPQVLEQFPKTVFLWLGEGVMKAALEEEVRRMGLTKSVIFAGYQTDLGPFWEAFDLMVVPSHMEGLNSSLLDGLAHGKPTVAAAAGGIPEVIRDGENGLLVPIRSPESLAKGLIRLLKDREYARRLASNGPPTIRERFSVEKMVEGTASIYRELCS